MPELGNPQTFNRYSYTLNNPTRYTDPTGHISDDNIAIMLGVNTYDEVLAMFGEGGRLAGRWGWLAALHAMSGVEGEEVRIWMGTGPTDDWDSATYVGKVVYQRENNGLTWGGYGTWGLSIAGTMWDVFVAGTVGSAYGVSHVNNARIEDKVTQLIYGGTQYVPNGTIRYDSGRVDWTAAGLDTASIAADILTLGAAAKVKAAAKFAGDLISVTSFGYQALRRAGAGNITRGEYIGSLLVDASLMAVPVIPAATSLTSNLFGGYYASP